MFMAATLPFSITLVIVSILALPHLQVLSSSISKLSGFSLELIHRDSPHSPFYPGNLTQLERFQRLIEISKNQVGHLQSMREFQLQKHNSTYHPTIISSLIYQRFLYLVALTLGTPPVLNYLLLDTGSDFIWTQCQPLEIGFHQTPKLFDPRGSSTYRKFPCSQCVHPGFQCIGGECVFATRYITGARAKGIVSVDSFGFLTRVKGRQQVNNIIFGCANHNTGFTTFNGSITGILGMNMGTFSLVTQLGNIANRRFSHCLSRVSDPNRAPTYLRFGIDIPTRTGLQSTPLVPYLPVPGQFAVNLIDISIGNRRLGFPPGTFALKPDGKGGCLVDSETAVTHMVRGPYEVVKNTVLDYFRPFGLRRKSSSEIPFDLCYELPTTFRNFLRMTFHFQGADLHVKEEHAFFIAREHSVFCLAMMEAERFTTLGAFQQQNTRFIYDVGQNMLSFVPEDCTAERA